MSRLTLLILSLILLAYPFAVYFGLQYLQPRDIGLLILAILILRYLIARKHLQWDMFKSLVPITAASGILCLLILIFNQASLVRLNPAIINLVFLSIFGYTLYNPPSIIERLARLSEPNLPAQAVTYTRNVTRAWCIFFLINGAIAVYTCFYASLEIWTLYNGLIAYLLMGLLFITEYCIRRKKLKAARP
jgi:uncharacterized membrane protein